MASKKNKVQPVSVSGIASALTDLDGSEAYLNSDIVNLNSVNINPDNPRIVGRISPEEIVALREGKIKESDLSKIKLKYFNKIKELSESIEEEGLIQPIVVHSFDEGFELDAGERRYLSHLYLNKSNIQIIIRRNDYIIGSPEGKLKELTIALNENEQRENLSLEDLINSFIALDELLNTVEGEPLTATRLMKVIHKSMGQCSKFISIIRDETGVLDNILNGSITSARKAYEQITIAKKPMITALSKGDKPPVIIKNSTDAPLTSKKSKEGEKINTSKPSGDAKEGDSTNVSNSSSTDSNGSDFSKGPLQPPSKEEHASNIRQASNSTHVKLGNIDNINLLKLLLEKVLDASDFDSLNFKEFSFNDAQAQWDYAIAKLGRTL